MDGQYPFLSRGRLTLRRQCPPTHSAMQPSLLCDQRTFVYAGTQLMYSSESMTCERVSAIASAFSSSLSILTQRSEYQAGEQPDLCCFQSARWHSFEQ